MDIQPTPPTNVLQQPALPTPVVVTPTARTVTAPKHFLAAFFLSFFLGVFGADRFYLGYYGQGILKLLTFGWLGIGAIVDLALVMNGAMRTKSGIPLAGYDDYKEFAKKTVLWITVGAGVLIVVSAVFTFIGIEQALSQFKSSDVSNLLGGGSSSGGASDSDIDSLLSQSGL